MLPRQHRLTRNKDFQKVFKEGKYISVRNGFLCVKFLKNTLGFSRFGFIVSSKVSNKANKRNRIRRVLQGIVLNKLATVKPGFDVVIIAKKAVGGKSFKDISSTINSVFGRIK